VKIEADSFMIIFKRPESALACAIAMQHACSEAEPRPGARGAGALVRGHRLRAHAAHRRHRRLRPEVNAASKLGEDTARSNEILVTHAVRERCATMAGISFSEHEAKVPGSDRNYRVGYPSV
jgi:hypothetical protein